MEINLNLDDGTLTITRDSRAELNPLRIHQGDRTEEGSPNLFLYLCRRAATEDNPLTVVALPAPFTKIIIAARTAANLTEANLLFSVTEFTSAGAGDTQHYEGILNANTDPILAKFAAAAVGVRTLSALVDITFENDAATIQETPIRQWPCLITRDMYAGTEGVPVDGDPAYPLPGVIQLTTAPALLPDGAFAKFGRMTPGTDLEIDGVVFTTPFADIPRVVIAHLLNTAGYIIACSVDYGSLSAEGFSVRFGAPIPDASYRLDWFAIL